MTRQPPPPTVAISSDWAGQTVVAEIVPLFQQLAGELAVGQPQADRLLEALVAAFVRGVRRTAAEVTAQMLAQDVDARLECSVDDGWESG